MKLILFLLWLAIFICESYSQVGKQINGGGIYFLDTKTGWINWLTGLINIHYINGTSELSIYNNTLYGEQNQLSLLNTVYYPNTIPGRTPPVFRINNNIFYKADGSSNQCLLKFSNIDTLAVNNNILNNNLYYIENRSNTDEYKVAFAKYNGSDYCDEFTKKWNYNWDLESKVSNPQFISGSDFHIAYSSPAKNLGKGLLNEGVLTDYTGTERPYWNKDFDCGAMR